MQEKPRVVVSRTPRAEQVRADFAFQRSDVPASTGFAAEYRERAWAAYLRQALPDTSQEAWRRTDLRPLPIREFTLSDEGVPAAPVPAKLMEPLADGQHGGQIVIGTAGHGVTLEAELTAKGVIFTDLLTAEASHPEILGRILGQTVNAEEGKFAAMAAALARDGVLLYVPKGLTLDFPLHSILWGAGATRAHFSHILVFLDEGSSATYVHESASPTDGRDALHAGLGTDFDGGFGMQVVPAEIDTIADLQKLVPLLSEKGYTTDDITAILGGNWLRHLHHVLPESL